MTANQIIQQLTEMVEKHGDREVVIVTDDGSTYPVDIENQTGFSMYGGEYFYMAEDVDELDEDEKPTDNDKVFFTNYRR